MTQPTLLEAMLEATENPADKVVLVLQLYGADLLTREEARSMLGVDLEDPA